MPLRLVLFDLLKDYNDVNALGFDSNDSTAAAAVAADDDDVNVHGN